MLWQQSLAYGFSGMGCAALTPCCCPKNNECCRTSMRQKFSYRMQRRLPARAGHLASQSLGFTLIELMVTVAVTAILLTIAVPSYKTVLQNDQQLTSANSVVYLVNYARSEAVKRDLPVSVCPYDYASAPSTPACGTDWSKGWMAYFVPAGSTSKTALQTFPPAASNTAMTATVSGSAVTLINFMPNGTTSAAVKFNLCDDRGASYARGAELLISGRIQVSPTPGKALNGSSLTCS